MGHLEFCDTVLEAKCVHDLVAAFVFVIDVVTVRTKFVIVVVVVVAVISAVIVCAARNMFRNKVADTAMSAHQNKFKTK